MYTKKIILASKSPRRRVLMQRILPRGRIIFVESDVQEIRRKGEVVEEFCMRMAKNKATSAWKKCKGKTRGVFAVIGADTVVLFKKQIIGQPRDSEDARRILRKLSGNSHEVITGVAIFSPSSVCFVTFAVRSMVWMHDLSREEIEAYVATGEPLDKAGAYAIQGRGRKLVAKYEGSYSNIVGLPVAEMRKALKVLV